MTAEVAQQENNNIKYYVSAFKYIQNIDIDANTLQIAIGEH